MPRPKGDSPATISHILTEGDEAAASLRKVARSAATSRGEGEAVLAGEGRRAKGKGVNALVLPIGSRATIKTPRTAAVSRPW